MKLSHKKFFATWVSTASKKIDPNRSRRPSTVARLLTAYVLVFILADLVPHPSLKPGILSSAITQIQKTFSADSPRQMSLK